MATMTTMTTIAAMTMTKRTILKMVMSLAYHQRSRLLIIKEAQKLPGGG